MKRLADLGGLLSLKWTQRSPFELAFELREVDEVLATLTFRDLSFASAEAAEGTWTFDCAFVPARVTVRAPDHSEIARYRGGTLMLADGRAWRSKADFFTHDFEFRNEKDEPLVKYQQVEGLFRASSYMVITPEGASLAELPWLVTLGWCFVAGSAAEPSADSG